MATTQGSWVIDTSHSNIGFVVRHLMSKVRGSFQEFEGKILGNPEDLTGSTAEFSANVHSVHTNQPDRDKHLRSSDFFDAENFPTLKFQSKRVEKTGEGTYIVYGDLTIRGVTREVPVTVEYLGTRPDPWGGMRAGFECSAHINRKDFGVSFNQVLETGGVLVGENVDIELELETVQQQ